MFRSGKWHRQLLRDIAFCSATSGSVYLACSVAENKRQMESIRSNITSFHLSIASIRNYVNTVWSDLGRINDPPTAYYKNQRKLSSDQKQTLAKHCRHIDQLPLVPSPLKQMSTFYYTKLFTWFVTQSPSQRSTLLLLSTFVPTFIVIRRLPSFSRRFLLNQPLTSSPTCFSLVGSLFAHASLFHLGANSYAAYTFLPNLMDMTDSTFHVLGATFMFGCMASLASRYGWSYVQHATRSGSFPGSLGASGALFGVFGMTAAMEPNARVELLFVPGWKLDLHDAFVGTCILDIVGILTAMGTGRGLLVLDHFAHIGGAVAGYWYGQTGQHYMWPWIREQGWKVLQWKEKMDQP